MAIKREYKKGKFKEYRNATYIPAFLFIPQGILEATKSKELISLPRTKRELLYNKEAIKVIESDLFRLLIRDGYAFMVWPVLCPGVPREIYSGYEPSWILAHDPDRWINALHDINYLPSPQEWYTASDWDYYYNYMPIEAVEFALQLAVPYEMGKSQLYDVLDIAKENRCFEDFDTRNSTQKIDFYRQWYHTQTQHPQISLDGFKAEYAKAHDGQEWDIEDESSNFEDESVINVLAEQFMKTLSEKDAKILEMRLNGVTLKDIAKELGYANHSGVEKRIRRIGQAFEKYADVDYGFDGKHILY